MKKKFIIIGLSLTLLFAVQIQTLAFNDFTTFEDEIVDPTEPTPPPTENPTEPTPPPIEEPVDPTPPPLEEPTPPTENPTEPTPPSEELLGGNSGGTPVYYQPTYVCGVNVECLPNTGNLEVVYSLSAVGVAGILLLFRKGVRNDV